MIQFADFFRAGVFGVDGGAGVDESELGKGLQILFLYADSVERLANPHPLGQLSHSVDSGLTAVSYTHLEVYKRQSHTSLFAREFLTLWVSLFWLQVSPGQLFSITQQAFIGIHARGLAGNRVLHIFRQRAKILVGFGIRLDQAV